MTRTSHIKKLRNRYELNRLYILSTADLNLMQYNQMIFDNGIRFLEEIYPRHQFDNIYKLVAYDKNFWKWWLAEWQRWEDELIEFTHQNNTILDAVVYSMEMGQIWIDGQTEYIFYENYKQPKIKQHVITV